MREQAEMRAMTAERRTPGSGSARKVLQILFSFSERRTSATVAEFAELVGAPIPTAYRHVALLKELQLLEEGRDGRYHPTVKVMPLARAAQLSNTLAELARPFVSSASEAFDETVMLMQHYGDAVVCVEVKETTRSMRFTFQSGHTAPLGVGASGKLVLALLPQPAQQDWLRLGRRPDIAAELPLIASSGFATSDGEIDAGVWACSVPVVSGSVHPVVLTVAGPAARFDDAKRMAAPEILQQHARQTRILVEGYSL